MARKVNKVKRPINPRKYNSWIRTIINFVRYHKFVIEIYYKNGDRELLADLMRKTADYGFNNGVEAFFFDQRLKNISDNTKKKVELRKLARTGHTQLEEMAEARKKEQEAKKKQQEIKNEPKPVYNSKWRPSLDEIKQYPTYFKNEYWEGISYAVYIVREKASYVAVIEVEDGKPKFFLGDDYEKVNKTGWSEYSKLVEGRPMRKKQEPVKQSKVKNEPKIDISHVEEAMGINNRMNNKNDDIDDLLDNLF